ncbi:MAG: formate/nitrite transporter family protein [Verrucomicrobiales bacterium]|jgi:formate/nitrite transporter|nr:formate/nitrite transporter family protein [Verrucomicrobiales bacterium]
MAEIFGADAYSPKQIAERVRSVGVTKARLPLLSLIALGVLAGGFIGLGANFYNVVTSDPSLGYATARLLGGLVFSLGLILVVVAGAELFTGNNLMVMAWVSREITLSQMLRNLGVVYLANFIGAAGLATLVVLSGQWQGNSGSDGNRALVIAEAKVSLPFMEAFFRGVLCNILVCLAVWLAMAARHVSGKILAIIFPISAFVAAGFEHCVANMYFIPLGLLLDAWTPLQTSGTLSWQGLIHNLVPVTLGNLVGGAGMVGLVYYVIYVRGERA